MVSYAEFHQMPARMEKAKSLGLRKYLEVPKGVKIFLDNGAFYFLRHRRCRRAQRVRRVRRVGEAGLVSHRIRRHPDAVHVCGKATSLLRQHDGC